MRRFGSCVLNPALVVALVPSLKGSIGATSATARGVEARRWEVVLSNGTKFTIDRESAVLLMGELVLPDPDAGGQG